MSDMGDGFSFNDWGVPDPTDLSWSDPAEYYSGGYTPYTAPPISTGSGSTGGFNVGSLLQSLFGGGQPGAPGSFNAMQTGTPTTGYQASITAGPTPSAGTFFSEYGGYILGGGALLLLIAVLSKSGD